MTTTNFIDGVTNATRGTALGTFVAPDPTLLHTWFSDFDNYVSGDWTKTGTGAAAIISEDLGIVKLTNSNVNGENTFLQWAGNSGGTKETWKFNANKQMWMKARFKLSDATASGMVIGLQVTDTSPLATSDGAYFYKAKASTTLQFITTQNSTATTSTVGTLANDTYVNVGFYYDGGSNVFVYLNDRRVVTQASTNVPLTQTLTLSFGVENGAAAIKTMSVDYLLVSEER